MGVYTLHVKIPSSLQKLYMSIYVNFTGPLRSPAPRCQLSVKCTFGSVNAVAALYISLDKNLTDTLHAIFGVKASESEPRGVNFTCKPIVKQKKEFTLAIVNSA